MDFVSCSIYLGAEFWSEFMDDFGNFELVLLELDCST
jgi:hypothetical protein